MSEHLPERRDPAWGGPVQGGSLRIGDAERDTAVEELSEHFVAGRLTQDEFEERSDQATRARYADEVELLFADLPELVAKQQGRGRRHPRTRAGAPPPFLWIIPVLMLGLVVSSVLLVAPWLLWMVFWVAMFSGPVRNGRWQQGGRRG
ncbi:DUF1707 domain-containing protein [Streptomyces sp. SID13031]|uniref:DUF1707 SHOCT-like domain-containing protein n=1 Tax=Streptomyces sp. SID13031 TaxID=2706046 RepID=UPI0013C83E16|nr:DUF1707 domain-containing protein [Streptomyces sp. SID13031]NEA37314.1 DUF1707 domain-containing protein [Streptomyces sp. SID13031]